MIEGCDYSYDWPGIPALKAAGKTFVCRYLTGTTNAAYGSKNLTRREADELQAAGLTICSNYETSIGFMLEGYDSGARRAAAAWQQHKACGGPDGRPIYFSLDMNATLNEYKQAFQFMRGAASAIGWDQVGMYGGLEQVDFAAQDGIKWLWQTFAWSFGNWSTHAKLRQYRNGVTLGSGTVDLDRALVADYGQWAATKEPFMWSDAEQADILKAARQILGAVAAGQTSFSGTIEATLASVQSLTNIVKGGQGSLAAGISDVRSAVLGAVAALPAPETPAEAEAATNQILDALRGLGIEGVSANALLDALAVRLAQ